MRVRSRTSAVLRFRSAIVVVDLIEFLNSLSCAKFSKKQEEEGGKRRKGASFLGTISILKLLTLEEWSYWIFLQSQ